MGEVQACSIRLDFSLFNGDKPERWLYKVKHFFIFHNTLSQHRLRLASFHMEGRAFTRFQDLEESWSLTDWDSFVQALLTRFETSCYDNRMETITRLKQLGSAKEYKTQFEVLSTRLRGLSENYKHRYFISGLRDGIRLLVKMFNPHNLLIAYSLAKIQDEHVALNKKNTRWLNPYSLDPGFLKTLDKNLNYPKLTCKNTLPVQKISQN